MNQYNSTIPSPIPTIVINPPPIPAKPDHNIDLIVDMEQVPDYNLRYPLTFNMTITWIRKKTLRGAQNIKDHASAMSYIHKIKISDGEIFNTILLRSLRWLSLFLKQNITNINIDINKYEKTGYIKTDGISAILIQKHSNFMLKKNIILYFDFD